MTFSDRSLRVLRFRRLDDIRTKLALEIAMSPEQYDNLSGCSFCMKIHLLPDPIAIPRSAIERA